MEETEDATVRWRWERRATSALPDAGSAQARIVLSQLDHVPVRIADEKTHPRPKPDWPFGNWDAERIELGNGLVASCPGSVRTYPHTLVRSALVESPFLNIQKSVASNIPGLHNQKSRLLANKSLACAKLRRCASGMPLACRLHSQRRSP